MSSQWILWGKGGGSREERGAEGKGKGPPSLGSCPMSLCKFYEIGEKRTDLTESNSLIIRVSQLSGVHVLINWVFFRSTSCALLHFMNFGGKRTVSQRFGFGKFIKKIRKSQSL